MCHVIMFATLREWFCVICEVLRWLKCDIFGVTRVQSHISPANLSLGRDSGTDFDIAVLGFRAFIRISRVAKRCSQLYICLAILWRVYFPRVLSQRIIY